LLHATASRALALTVRWADPASRERLGPRRPSLGAREQRAFTFSLADEWVPRSHHLPLIPRVLYSPRQKTEKGKEGIGSCNARGKIPPAPCCCRARQAPCSAPQAHHATVRARSTFSHAPRARDCHGPLSALPPCHRQLLAESKIGIINSNHTSSDCPSPSQGSISTLHAARLPSCRPPCHGRARSIKLHPMLNLALSITIPPPPW
jgi:hypothetical protein